MNVNIAVLNLLNIVCQKFDMNLLSLSDTVACEISQSCFINATMITLVQSAADHVSRLEISKIFFENLHVIVSNTFISRLNDSFTMKFMTIV